MSWKRFFVGSGEEVNWNDDESIFANIQASKQLFQVLGGLPRVVGLWEPHEDWHGSCQPGPWWGQGAFPTFILPQLPERPPAASIAFPSHAPNAGWQETVQALVSAIVDVGAAGQFGDGLELIQAFLEFYFVNFGGAVNWQDVMDSNVPQVKYAQLAPAHARTLYYRWMAVCLVSELGGWYPWSLAEGGQTSIEHFARWQVADPDLVHGGAFFPDAQLPFWKFTPGVVAIHAPLSDPVPAVQFALRLVENAKPNSDLSAVYRLTDWFHGPENAYASGVVIDCEKKWCPATYDSYGHKFYGGVCEPINTNPNLKSDYSLEKPPYPLQQFVVDGSQSWVHEPIGYMFNNWFFQELANHGQRPWSYEAVSVYKLGGCDMNSSFFAATATALAVPISVGGNPLITFMGGDVGTTSHGSLWLPTFQKALLHGDDLWGPGASLFPASQLWQPASEVLAWRDYLASLPAEGVFPSGSWFWGDSKVHSDAWTPKMRRTLATYLAISASVDYRVSLNYFTAMLKWAFSAEYAGIVRDAVIFQASGLSIAGKPLAFGAIKKWAGTAHNRFSTAQNAFPLPASLWANVDWSVVLPVPDAGPTAPRNVWEDPTFQMYVDLIYEEPAFELSNYARAAM